MNLKKRIILTIMICFESTMLFSSEQAEIQQNNSYCYPFFEKQATVQDEHLYDEASRDRIKFWEKCAEDIDWFSPWTYPFLWSCPYAQWFINGKLNLSYNCLDRHLKEDGDKIAFFWCNEIGQEKQISYKEMHREVCRLANALKNLGIKKGEVVAIYMPMTIEGIASMLACARIGAVHSVIFGGTGEGSLREKVNDSRAKAILTADITYRRGKTVPLQDKIDNIIENCPTVEKVIVLQRSNEPKVLAHPKYVSYKEIVNKCSDDCPPEVMDAEDMLFVLYTSGTTGKPKGIIHTTGGYLVGVHNTFKWVFDYKSEDVFWCTADIGWITGHSYVVYGPMSNGATQVIYEGTYDYPRKNIAWEIVEKYKVSTFYTAPTLIRIFMKWGADWLIDSDISSIRLLGSIGEPLNPEAWHWYHENIGRRNCPIVDTWFQTETGAFVIAPIPGLTSLKPGSVSKALPGFDVAVLDEEGMKVSHGLLAITSPFPSMLRGVLNDPDRYYKTYWEKWNGLYYFAGDTASMDDDCYFWVQGRSDEVLKVSGHRIGTAEIENIIVDFPCVAEAAVIGTFDELKGQKIIAFVVLKDGVEIPNDLSNLIKQHVSNHMGKYAEPYLVVFVSDLPKTRSGKILRRLLKNLVEGNPVGDTSTLVNPSIIEELQVCCTMMRNNL